MRAYVHTQIRRVVTALSVSVFLVGQKRNIIRLQPDAVIMSREKDEEEEHGNQDILGLTRG